MCEKVLSHFPPKSKVNTTPSLGGAVALLLPSLLTPATSYRVKTRHGLHN